MFSRTPFRITKFTRILCAAPTAVILMLTAQMSQAQDWPTRPLRMMVGASPGGGTDLMARAISDPLGQLLKQPVVVENRPGVSNTLAAETTARATDGATMVMGVATAHAIVPHLMKLSYDSNRDLVPVAYVGAVPNVLVVPAALPVANVQELIALARKKPGELNFASSGVGSTQHLAAVMFQNATGVDIRHVPYKGSGTALVDLISGNVQLNFDTLPSVIAQIRTGKIRALAVMTKTRNAQLPDVPTLSEAGVPGVVMSTWYGLYMPSATPQAVQTKLHDAVNKVLESPDVRARVGNAGGEVTGMSQAQFQDFQAAEYKRFGEIIAKNNIKLE